MTEGKFFQQHLHEVRRVWGCCKGWQRGRWEECRSKRARREKTEKEISFEKFTTLRMIEGNLLGASGNRWDGAFIESKEGNLWLLEMEKTQQRRDDTKQITKRRVLLLGQKRHHKMEMETPPWKAIWHYGNENTAKREKLKLSFGKKKSGCTRPQDKRD